MPCERHQDSNKACFMVNMSDTMGLLPTHNEGQVMEQQAQRYCACCGPKELKVSKCTGV